MPSAEASYLRPAEAYRMQANAERQQVARPRRHVQRGHPHLARVRLTAAGERIRLGDTWEWDGRRWTRMSDTGPSPRSGGWG